MSEKTTQTVQDSDCEPVNADTRNKMFKKICGLIPGKVSNATVLRAFEVMRKSQSIRRRSKLSVENLKKNTERFQHHLETIEKHRGYVEDQNNYRDMHYGVSTMQYSGCEIFAVFNALFNLTGKHPVPLHHLIEAFEADGMVLSGKFGTAPRALVDFFNRNGFHAVITTKEGEFDRLGRDSDSLILTMYNDGEDISKEVHTVNISKEHGGLVAHNVYCNGATVGPAATVTELIARMNNGKAKGISLIGIKK